jgi:flagellar motility protein MotE (MotC chaperone)
MVRNLSTSRTPSSQNSPSSDGTLAALKEDIKHAREMNSVAFVHLDPVKILEDAQPEHAASALAEEAPAFALQMAEKVAPPKMAKIFEAMAPDKAKDIIAKMPKKMAGAIFSNMPMQSASAIFSHMNANAIGGIFYSIKASKAAEILVGLQPGTAGEILQNISHENLGKVINNMPSNMAGEIFKNMPRESDIGLILKHEDITPEKVAEILQNVTNPSERTGRKRLTGILAQMTSDKCAATLHKCKASVTKKSMKKEMQKTIRKMLRDESLSHKKADVKAKMKNLKKEARKAEKAGGQNEVGKKHKKQTFLQRFLHLLNGNTNGASASLATIDSKTFHGSK